MIQIRYFIRQEKDIVTKKIQFCKQHEKNLDILYGITKENIEKKGEISLEQFTVICTFYVVKQLRRKRSLENIHSLLKDTIREKVNIVFDEIRKISIEATIDDIPKKKLNLHIHEFVNLEKRVVFMRK